MRTQTVLASIITCAVLALGTVAQAADSKVTGTWTWAQQGRGGQGGNANASATPRKSTLKLKADGDKLTGTLTQPMGGRGGGGGAAAAAPTPALSPDSPSWLLLSQPGLKSDLQSSGFSEARGPMLRPGCRPRRIS